MSSGPLTNRNRQLMQSVNRGLNDSLSRQYSGMTINEIIVGKRPRPLPPRPEKEFLTPDSIVKFCRQGKWGYKDWKGNVIIQPTFDEAYGFHEGVAWVEKDGKLAYINKKGDLLIDYKYDAATSFSEARASVSLGEKSGYIDMQGEPIGEMEYDVATPFFDGRAIVRQADRWGVLTADGKIMWR
ncbi:MAG: WG repeat-containing protein [Clostridia bacterium]